VRESLKALTRGAEETERLAARLVRARPALTQSPAIVYLSGELGSGKTTFVRGALRELGVLGTVRSPTYTLLERYDVAAITVLHLDLYRLRDEAELETLGVRELHVPAHLWFVEWPEHAASRLPSADLGVALEPGSHYHRITIRAESQLGIAWLERVPC
jgi:tRNA threonylcarbamoyladenosine biosynthesis protein TsaE